MAAVIREDGENKEDDFGGRREATDTAGPGFGGLLTQPLMPFAWWMLVCGEKYKVFLLADTKKEGTPGLERMPAALNWCVSLYTRHIA